MKRYIEVDKLMEEIHRIGGHNLCEWHTIGVKALIDRQPIADVVEVVRCKDCVYFIPHEPPIEDFDGWCPLHENEYDKEFYCQYGERREENEG